MTAVPGFAIIQTCGGVSMQGRSRIVGCMMIIRIGQFYGVAGGRGSSGEAGCMGDCCLSRDHCLQRLATTYIGQKALQGGDRLLLFVV